MLWTVDNGWVVDLIHKIASEYNHGVIITCAKKRLSQLQCKCIET